MMEFRKVVYGGVSVAFETVGSKIALLLDQVIYKLVP